MQLNVYGETFAQTILPAELVLQVEAPVVTVLK
jgi:hypothetical protein